MKCIQHSLQPLDVFRDYSSTFIQRPPVLRDDFISSRRWSLSTGSTVPCHTSLRRCSYSSQTGPTLVTRLVLNFCRHTSKRSSGHFFTLGDCYSRPSVTEHKQTYAGQNFPSAQMVRSAKRISISMSHKHLPSLFT